MNKSTSLSSYINHLYVRPDARNLDRGLSGRGVIVSSSFEIPVGNLPSRIERAVSLVDHGTTDERGAGRNNGMLLLEGGSHVNVACITVNLYILVKT